MGAEPIKRKDIGIAGALVILAQAFSNRQSTSDVSREIERLRGDLKTLQIDQEKFFVRKEELKKVVVKLDKMNSRLVSIKNFLNRSGNRSLATYACD